MNSAGRAKGKVLDAYYSSAYSQLLFSGGAQGRGIDFLERSVESFWSDHAPRRTLELGAGSGEHLPYVKDIPSEQYVALDLHPMRAAKAVDDIDPLLRDRLKFVAGNAESMPFHDGDFDRVVSTCLLHHVSDPLSVMFEVRRVLRPGGEFAVVMPTDPGLMNQLVKRLITYRKMRGLTNERPQLVYALEHQNQIGGLIEMLKFAFAEDAPRFYYEPLKVRSWNLNLLVVMHLRKRSH